MTTSVYDVIKYTDLALYMGGITFTTIDTLYTQAVVESWISEAEQLLATITGEEPDSDNDFHVAAVKMLAERIAYDTMIKNNNAVKAKEGTMTSVIKDVMELYELSKQTKQEASGIDIHNYDGNYISW